MADDIAQHDRRARHCPMLGHEVSFAYCRAPGRDIPCRKVLDCWWETFDAEFFVRTYYNPDQMRDALAPPAPKLATLVELIEKARRTRPPS